MKVEKKEDEYSLQINNKNDLYKDAIFFDLEHYVYKKPICIGVFGSGYYDNDNNEINLTQYMIENKRDSLEILNLAKNYFQDLMNNKNKKYIVTFSGNNDFTVINYLLKKNNIEFSIEDSFKHIDLQREYEKAKGNSIGLKALEKDFSISRESELISGQNLAKTFSKVMKDDDYINRMPEEKKKKILLYNQQDVVSLFYIYTNWFKVI
ncbi:ribonuclease H-like domain-containing protein [Clostridium rectalis]|uniref:ribonuclease H-like domain-containing protein n=1 Tax=Clostridium rectalis TaxID=2040295 RepID=UPI001FAA4DB0|nr:ribonuclease H-like domain-containing protein [Clostridium rectalis]